MDMRGGKIYTEPKDIRAARLRGEKLTPLTEEEYEHLAPMMRHLRRRELVLLRRKKRKALKQQKEAL